MSLRYGMQPTWKQNQTSFTFLKETKIKITHACLTFSMNENVAPFFGFLRDGSDKEDSSTDPD